MTMHSWFRETGCPEIIVANKLDKLKKSQVEPALSLIQETLEKGSGKEELLRLLNAACDE